MASGKPIWGLSQQLEQVRELAHELALWQQELLRKIHDLVASIHQPLDSGGA